MRKKKRREGHAKEFSSGKWVAKKGGPGGRRDSYEKKKSGGPVGRLGGWRVFWGRNAAPKTQGDTERNRESRKAGEGVGFGGGGRRKKERFRSTKNEHKMEAGLHKRTANRTKAPKANQKQTEGGKKQWEGESQIPTANKT